LDDLNVCVGGTINVLEAAIKLQPMPLVVLTSTAAVYGNESYSGDTAPISPYGAAKLAAEEYVRMYGRLYGLQYKIVRFFNVYGPRQHKYVMYDTLRKLRDNSSELKLLGDGTEYRDYIYVLDALDQLLAAPVGYEIDIATGIPTRTSEVARQLCALRGCQPSILYDGPWKGNIKYLVCPFKRLVKVPLSEGLYKLVQWFDSQ